MRSASSAQTSSADEKRQPGCRDGETIIKVNKMGSWESPLEYSKAYVREYNARNRARNTAKTRRWNLADPERRRDSTRKHEYKMEPGAYREIYITQSGLCAICGNPPPEGHILEVDHDHATNKVRGLLCRKCNIGLGGFEDVVERLSAAIAYLTK